MSAWFDTFGWKFKKKDDVQSIKAGYVAPQNDDATFVLGEGYYGSYAYQLNFDQNIVDDFTLIHKYRSIAMHPEVDRAINEICNEVIDGTTKSAPLEIVLDELEQPETIKTKIRSEFDQLMKLMNFNKDSYKIFRKWYVDGRMFYHIIIDKNRPADGIQELRYISPLHIKKIREEKTELQDGIPVVVSYEDYFIYSRDLKNTTTPGTGGIKLTTDSVAYCNSGLVDESRNLVYSYLQKSIRACNQLRMEEDAIVIYRIARAPERRVFSIEIGNIPRGKGEEHLRQVQARFKNKLVYDASQGEVKDATNMMSMLEDYWLPTRDGKGSSITTLPGGQNLGEIQDIDYFRKKLFESLGVPLGRLMSDQSGAFGLGRSGEITREEVQFGAFIERLRKEFSSIFMDLLRTQLILKKIISPDEWEELAQEISFDFASNTYFAELKENEIFRERITTLQLIDPAGPFVGKYYSVEWLKKNILKQSDDDIKEMQKQMDEENKQAAEDLANGTGPQPMMGPEPIQDPNALLPEPSAAMAGQSQYPIPQPNEQV